MSLYHILATRKLKNLRKCVTMATFGFIGEFSEGKETWSMYIDRLEQYFEANELTDPDRKRAILNSVVGAETYQLITRLLAPRKPKDATFEEITTAVQNHCCPTTSVIVERFKFNSRFRRPGESVANYVAELRGLAQKCDFGTSLQEMLRDRIVCGVNDDRIQKNLLAQGDKLDFKKALEMATTMELAEQQARDLTSGKAHQVHKVNTDKRKGKNQQHYKAGNKPHGHRFNSSNNTNTSNTARKPCYRCGKTDHYPDKCWAKGLNCNKCDKVGHIAKVCQSSAKKTNYGQPSQQVHAVTQQEPPHSQSPCSCSASGASESSPVEYAMYQHRDPRPSAENPIYVDVVVNDKELQMELDTGAGKTVISETVYNKLWGPDKLPLSEPDCILNTYTKQDSHNW